MSDFEAARAPSAAEGARGRPRWAVLPWLAAIGTSVLWGSAFVGIRAAGTAFDPGALTLGRTAVASLVLTAVVVVRASRLAGGPADAAHAPRGRLLLAVLGWGVAWFGLYNLALNTAEQVLDAGTAALLVGVAPLVVVVLAGTVLGEGFPRGLVIGVGVAFAGVVGIAIGTGIGGAGVGVALGLAAAGLYGLAATAQKRLLRAVDPLTMTWLGSLAGTAAALPFLPRLVAQASAAPWSATAAVVFLGAFPTAAAFLVWGYALRHLPVSRAVAATYGAPVVAVGLSALLLAESPAPIVLAGGTLCLAGVVIATRPARGRRETAARRATALAPGA